MPVLASLMDFRTQQLGYLVSYGPSEVGGPHRTFIVTGAMNGYAVGWYKDPRSRMWRTSGLILRAAAWAWVHAWMETCGS